MVKEIKDKSITIVKNTKQNTQGAASLSQGRTLEAPPVDENDPNAAPLGLAAKPQARKRQQS